MLLDKFMATFNTHDYAALVQLYDEDAALAEPGREVIRGRNAIRKHWAEKFQAFPDIQVNYTHLLACDSVAMAEGRIQATHTGVYATPTGQRLPGTGRTLDIPFMTCITTRGGGIVSQQVYFDRAEVMRQLLPTVGGGGVCTPNGRIGW